MNGNLAYWQLDFTVESQANLAPDCMVMLEKFKSFRGPRRPPNPGLLYSSAYGLRRTAFGRARPTVRHYFQIFSSRPGLIPGFYMVFLIQVSEFKTVTSLNNKLLTS